MNLFVDHPSSLFLSLSSHTAVSFFQRTLDILYVLVRFWLVFKVYRNIDTAKTAAFPHARMNALINVPSGAHCQCRHLNMNSTRSLPVFLLFFSLCLLWQSYHGNHIWFPNGGSELVHSSAK